ncbi:hypothetical protein EUGRSUZ_I02316 [Eucalyptus grandis]|uniref:Uncharacterized protein n=2 Tax=Eucalyptus grandis TaxID=71139 RepID=A0A059AT36_EUCGR|nr:hypothetical protein EUGRSUZ_I02316 [Eucalyptus grandis]
MFFGTRVDIILSINRKEKDLLKTSKFPIHRRLSFLLPLAPLSLSDKRPNNNRRTACPHLARVRSRDPQLPPDIDQRSTRLLHRSSSSISPSTSIGRAFPMALASHFLAAPAETSFFPRVSAPSQPPSCSGADSPSSARDSSARSSPMNRRISLRRSAGPRRLEHTVKAAPQQSEVNTAAEAFNNFKHLLLPITDRNPYLSEGTRQAVATTAALAKKYGADITVVVIDKKQKETLPEHETQLSSIRWHLSEGLLCLPTFLNLDFVRIQFVPASIYFLDISNSALIL